MSKLNSLKLSARMLCVASLLLVMGDCGPMNDPAANPGAGSACSGAGQTLASAEGVGFSKKHAFVVVTKLLNGTGDGSSTPNQGSNQYQVRILRGADLQLPRGAKVTAEYTHFGAHGPHTYPAEIEAQSGGDYLLTVSFPKPGSWEIHLHVSDDRIEDDHVLPITL